MRVLRLSHSAVVDAWRERERELRRRGLTVRLLSALRWDEGGRMVPLVPRPGEDVGGVRTWGRHPALFVFDPRPLWRALGDAWDVIDIHEEPYALATAEVLALKALRRNRAPYALYSAQNIDKTYPIPFRWLERWALRRAAGMSVCNAEAGAQAVRKGLPVRPRTIALGIDPQLFRPGARPVNHVAVVGYAGRLAPHKGVTVLLEAIALTPELRVRIAGGGPDEDALRLRADQADLRGRVEFLGALDDADLPGFYRGLDVLAVPSVPTPGWIEQFGRVAIEAMACGTPVVASDCGSLPDVVGDAGLVVPAGDADALAEALARIVREPGLAAECVGRGLIRAAGCSWETVAADYADLYTSMVRDPSPAPRGVEVVVVAYGAAELLRRALEPLRRLPVTVVDNSSDPAVRSVCDGLGVRYLDPGRNGGFAAGVNAALADRLAPGADVLLMNPDAEFAGEDVAVLQRRLLAEPDLASVAPAQVDAAGGLSRVSWPFPSPWGTLLEAVGLGRLRPRNGFVIGSVLLLRAEALDQIGGFDERFFLYAEETDWAYRARLVGWRHAVVDEVQAVHVGAATSTDPARREAHFHASQEKYLRKHFGAVGWQVARLVHVAGATARGLLLPAERRQAARARAKLYRRGPAKVEASYEGAG